MAKTTKKIDLQDFLGKLKKNLEQLPTEKIVEELNKHTKDTLNELAEKMNVPVQKKLKKDVMIDKIFKLGIANKRGYQLLSEDNE